MIERVSVFRQASVTITSLALTLCLAMTLSLGSTKAVATDHIVLAQAFPGQGQYHMPPAFSDEDEVEDNFEMATPSDTPTEADGPSAAGNAESYSMPPADHEAAAQTDSQDPSATASAPEQRDDTPTYDAPITGEYVLGVGDRVAVEVYGEEDLSGEFEIDGTGRIFMPLIGTINLSGLTMTHAQRAIVNKLTPDYLKDPKVSIAVTNFRDYYILGEVSSPGAMPYKSGLTVINAIALSGGYTGRASKEKITVVRASDPDKKEVRIGLDDHVQPGDILRIKQRLF